MYTPEHFRIDDAGEVHAIMRVHPFAMLVSSGSLGLFATHLPTVTKLSETGALTVECHLARANPHWKDLAAAEEAMLVYRGVESYVTPNWYPSKAETHKAVPTWNYEAVHAYGRPEVMTDGDWLRRHVAELSDQQEAGEPRPWSLAEAPEPYVQVMLRGIVGFRLAVTRLEGKRKASQNREPADRAGVVEGLRARARGDDRAMAAAVAAEDA